MTDLFETPELIPPHIDAILRAYTPNCEWDYTSLKLALFDVEKLGYTFEYYLDAEPFNLRIKTSLDYIIDKSGISTTEDKELITDAYNALHEDDKQMIDEMFIYKGIVYYTSHMQRTKEHTFICEYGDLNLFGETHEEIQDLINTYLLTIPNN